MLLSFSSPTSVHQPGKVNITAEEEVEDDKDFPDFSALGENTEKALLFLDQANGTAHYNLPLLHFVSS